LPRAATITLDWQWLDAFKHQPVWFTIDTGARQSGIDHVRVLPAGYPLGQAFSTAVGKRQLSGKCRSAGQLL
jgi:hypothetical protein